MSQLLPPIGTRGSYSLRSPWSTVPGVLYVCAAIRRFVDLENLGTKVFETYYEPLGVSRTVYEADRQNDVCIITLVSDTHPPLYVPSSFIAAYPDLSHRNYQHVVLSASLGPLPDYIELTFAKQQVAAVLSDVLGVEPDVHISVAPLQGTVSPDEHNVLEVAREAAIANRTTDHARVLRLEQQNTQLMQRLAIAEQLLKDHGIIPK